MTRTITMAVVTVMFALTSVALAQAPVSFMRYRVDSTHAVQGMDYQPIPGVQFIHVVDEWTRTRYTIIKAGNTVIGAFRDDEPSWW